MTIRLTQIEDQLAESPLDTTADKLAQLKYAERKLKDALQSPLSPGAHQHARIQAEALDAAIEILERLAQRFRSSYGHAGKRQP